jgi:hypothetical protein
MSDDDKTLLEKAAKAAGAEYEWDEDHIELITPIGGGSGYWNPLTDDGDAVRLAVKLRMDINQLTKSVDVWTGEGPFKRFTEPHGSDPCAATRRCIVRAAAAIGEAQ